MRTLLVANRGEIATRIFTTARSMGLRTVAVYADPDADLPFVTHADVAVRLPGSTAGETYLRIDRLLEAADLADADAVHPGYGFLAENAEFARAVIDAGLAWVGPPPDVIAAMGDKLEAKRIAAEAGVPLLPSVALEGDDPASWAAALDRANIRWPLLVKAAAGGGGRGMRVVTGPGDLEAAVVSARREAQSAFADPTVFAERLVRGGRHVEVQVFGDDHGTVVHLGERECSIQRRHQKIVEEAPSPGITDAVRERLCGAGLALARHIGYVNAGTVEFLVDGRGDYAAFYFLEMNTRLQVEHRVTEQITGLDLVGLQLRVARGEPLPIEQRRPKRGRHAIEVRLYAEDPARDFAPTFGRLELFQLRQPADATVTTDSVVGTEFDPLLAKVYALGATRDDAIDELAASLEESAILGVGTNRELLQAILRHRAFRSGDTTTDFLDRHPEVFAAPTAGERERRHAAAAALVRSEARRKRSPWTFAPSGWRNGVAPSSPDAVVLSALNSRDLRLWQIRFELDGLTHTAEVRLAGELHGENRAYVTMGDGWTEWVEEDRFPDPVIAGGGGGHGPVAPVPGTIVSVEVAPGDTVEAGQTLVVLEAMKMEHRIEAHGAGTVEAVLVAPGDRVDAHQLLVRLA